MSNARHVVRGEIVCAACVMCCAGQWVEVRGGVMRGDEIGGYVQVFIVHDK